MTTVIKAITVALVIQPARLEAITAGFIRMRAALAAVPVLGGLFLKKAGQLKINVRLTDLVRILRTPLLNKIWSNV